MQLLDCFFNRKPINTLAIHTIIALFLAFCFNFIPFIPSWKPVQISFLLILPLYILGVIIWQIIVIRRLNSKGIVTLLFSSVASTCLIFFTTQAIILELMGEWLSSETLINETHQCNGQLYVYHEDRFYDGFIEARIAKRIGWLPFENTLFTLEEPFYETNTKNSNAYLSFGSSGHIRFECSKGNLQRGR